MSTRKVQGGIDVERGPRRQTQRPDQACLAIDVPQPNPTGSKYCQETQRIIDKTFVGDEIAVAALAQVLMNRVASIRSKENTIVIRGDTVHDETQSSFKP